jgi:HK97 family phage portal protein
MFGLRKKPDRHERERDESILKFIKFLGGYGGQTGKDSTSFAAIDRICASFASLGFDFFRRDDRERTEHSLKNLLNDPNSEDTRFSFFYNSAHDYFCKGNVYWYKYDMDGEIVSLFRITPDEVRVQRDNITNEKIFIYNGATYTKDRIVHIPSRFGFNGNIGQDIFRTCDEVFKTSANLDEYAKNTFVNSVGKRLVVDLSAVKDLTNEQLEQYKDEFSTRYTGIKNAGLALMKRAGIDFNSVDSGNDNRAQQLEENRKFQEREISKIFGVPVELLNGSGKELEFLYTLFIDNAVRPIASQFEQAVNKFLLTPPEREYLYFEYSYNDLMRTSLQARIDAYVKQQNNGILTNNEIRKKENNPPVEAGDNLFVQANLMPLRGDVVEAYMASAKLKAAQISNAQTFHGENPQGMGDDKL